MAMSAARSGSRRMTSSTLPWAGRSTSVHRPPLALKVQIYNLLDSRKIDGLAGYTVAAATPLFWTQAGRSIFLTATTRF